MLNFTPSSFAAPFTMITAAEAAQRVTAALHGPWVFEHQSPAAKRRDEAEQAQEQALRDMYDLLRSAKLTAYVEDPRTHRFLRVPRDYYLDDGWEFSRCIALSRLMNDGIPISLEGQPILFLQTEIGAWVEEQNKAAASAPKRGRKPIYDWPAFLTEAASHIEAQGGYPTGEFDRPKLRAIMVRWCEDNWGETCVPEKSSLDEKFAQLERAMLDETNNLKRRD